MEGLTALRADSGALLFYVNNATRWSEEYGRRRSGAVESSKQAAMMQETNTR